MKKKQNNQKAKDKMAVVSAYISIITLNVNGLNLPIQSTEWLARQKKQTKKQANKTRLNYILHVGYSFQF